MTDIERTLIRSDIINVSNLKIDLVPKDNHIRIGSNAEDRVEFILHPDCQYQIEIDLSIPNNQPDKAFLKLFELNK